ncbi:uncharacterized protein A1O9_08006, partial [Exophiala aquamarina CBS 119918]
MSYIDLLFPREELEALGNKWTEPANKRRKLDLNAGLARGQRQQHQPQHQPARPTPDSQANQRRHTLSAASQPNKSASPLGSIQNTIKRSNSDVKLPISSMQPSANTKRVATPKSCLPSFIEPSILKNYLHHLHPNDRSRYSIPNSPEPETQPQRSEGPRRLSIMHHEHEDDSCSPASLITDNSSSTADNPESCPTPNPGIYEQLRDSRFGYLLHGLRLTDHEKDLVEDLLSPNQVDMPPPPAPSALTTSTKRKAEESEMGLSLENTMEFNQRLLQRMFPPDCDTTISEFSFFNNNAYRDSDVHSSGLSPGPQMEDEEEDVKQEESQ